MNTEVIPSDVPRNVTFVRTIFAIFRYPTAMPVGNVMEVITSFKMEDIGNRHCKFVLKKTHDQTVLITCERHGKDGTTNAGSAAETDDGYFLRLYISVIGIEEKPKSAVLRSTDSSTSVEFMEVSFLNPIVQTDYDYALKCVVRRIETTVLPNEEQNLKWQKCVKSACRSDKQRTDMAYILKRPNLMEVLTGRETELEFNWKCNIFSTACCYSEELVQYFEAKDKSESVPRTNNLGNILGHMLHGKKTSISVRDCLKFYIDSLRHGMMFVKDIGAAYIIENLNEELVPYVLEIADLTEDERLFEATSLFCIKSKLQFLQSEEWKWLASGEVEIVLGIIHNLFLRYFTDSQGFPPAMEDETAQP